jgi:hypothetical protein
MDLLLHTPTAASNLSGHYERAFNNAAELFVVTAYLTDWDSALKLNPECRRFRIIIGSDFGITRKAACEKVMRWLPPERKGQFMVADRIVGFHPKAVFWRDKRGECFALVGSSNLTRAAFETNYEANVFCQLSETEYIRGKKWVKDIEKQSVVVSEDWLKQYKEAIPTRTHGTKRSGKGLIEIAPLIELKLPTPRGMSKLLESRRKDLAIYQKQRVPLEHLFRRCANKEVSSEKFYNELPNYWSWEVGDRFQGAGWEIKGKHSDFQALSRSYIKILSATDEDRDDVVSEEIDELNKKMIPTRGAFLSEMLCLRFPDDYPVLNEPVWEYLKAVKYRAPRKSSEGTSFIFLATALRSSLLQNPGHPAKNLAELDSVIWLAYGKKNRSEPQR